MSNSHLSLIHGAHSSALCPLQLSHFVWSALAPSLFVCVGLEDSRKIVENLLNEEIKSGTPSNKIVLAGFSQGAAMSLYTGLQFPQPLAGIAALSGYLPWNKPPEQFAAAIHAGGNTKTPVLMLHGDADQVVRLQFGERSHHAIVSARKDNVQWKTYRGMAHHSCEEEMEGQATINHAHCGTRRRQRPAAVCDWSGGSLTLSPSCSVLLFVSPQT